MAKVKKLLFKNITMISGKIYLQELNFTILKTILFLKLAELIQIQVIC